MVPAIAYYVLTALGVALLAWAGYGLFAWSSFWAGALFAVLVAAGLLCLTPVLVANTQAILYRFLGG